MRKSSESEVLKLKRLTIARLLAVDEEGEKDDAGREAEAQAGDVNRLRDRLDKAA